MTDLKTIPMPEIVRRLIMFVGVGVINTAIGLAIILGLSEVLKVQYQLANAIGYGLGLVLSFMMHRNITFKDVSHMSDIRTQFGKFTTIFVVSYAIQFCALSVMEQMLRWPNWFSQIVACGLYVVISFTGSRLITFRASGPGESQ